MGNVKKMKKDGGKFMENIPREFFKEKIKFKRKKYFEKWVMFKKYEEKGLHL